MKLVSAQQSTAVPPLAPTARAVPARIARSLEENGTLVIVVATFGIVMLAALRHALVVDGWMALVSGREIAQHGLPAHDALAAWTAGDRWIDQQWLAQLLLYGLSRAGGVKLALLVHAALTSGALAGAAVLARRLGGSARATTWVCLPVMVAYYPESAVLRPQTFAYPLFVAVLWLLAADARTRSRRVFATLPILVLWANLHGSVLLGAALVSLAGVVHVAESLRRAHRRVSASGLVLTLAPWLCVLASPYALRLPAYYETILVGGNFSHFVTEWAPTTLTVATAPVYLLVLAGIWLLGRAGSRVSTFEKWALVATSLLAFQAVRNTAWFGLVALAVLPVLIDGVRRPVVEPRRLNRLLATAVLAGLLVAAAGVAAKSESWFTADFPTAAAGAASSAAGPNGKVFAMISYGDWLLWRRPELRGRIAFDARFELLSSAQVKRLGEFQSRVGDWMTAVRGYRVIVLDRVRDSALRTALQRSGSVRTVRVDRDVVVLRHVR
jgi:hypothetical protein